MWRSGLWRLLLLIDRSHSSVEEGEEGMDLGLYLPTLHCILIIIAYALQSDSISLISITTTTKRSI